MNWLSLPRPFFSCLALLATASFANAAPVLVDKLTVVYTNPGDCSGPLPFGLSEMPDEVIAEFTLRHALDDEFIYYDVDDVFSASLHFGDGHWTSLEEFDLQADFTGKVVSLSYRFNAINTATTENGIIMNFPLTIIGKDKETGEDFSCGYSDSTQTLIAVPEPSSLILATLGLLSLGTSRGRRRR